jgi:hypothetical protein
LKNNGAEHPDPGVFPGLEPDGGVVSRFYHNPWGNGRRWSFWFSLWTHNRQALGKMGKTEGTVVTVDVLRELVVVYPFGSMALTVPVGPPVAGRAADPADAAGLCPGSFKDGRKYL